MRGLHQFFLEIMAVAAREWQMIGLDKKLRSLILLAPLFNAALVSAVYAPSFVTEVPIAIVQQDNSALSRRMVRWFDQSQKLEVKDIVAERQRADQLLASGHISAYIVFESEFSTRIKQNQEARVLVINDASNLVLANTVSAAVQGITQTFNAGLAKQKARRLGAFKEQAQALVAPIRADIRSLGNPSFSYADFMLPGLLLTVLQQIILLGLAFAWAGESETKSWPQLFSLSSRSWPLLIGKNLPYVAIHLLWMAFFLGLLLPLSEVSSEAHLGSLLLFSLLFVLVMVSWGTWISLFLPDRLSATQALMFLAVPSFLLSGYTWPTSALPAVLQMGSQLLPLTHCAVMLRKLYGSGLSISDFAQEVQILFLFLAGHGLLSWWGLRRLRARYSASN